MAPLKLLRDSSLRSIRPARAARGGLLAPIAVAAFGLVAAADPTAPAGTEPHAGSAEAPAPHAPVPADSAAPPPLPAAAFDLLPPGVRPTLDDQPVAFTHHEAAWGRRVVEVVEHPSADLGAPARIEVEYTVDPELDARVEKVLERSRVAIGQVVLLDPATGEIFAYVSTDPVGFPATRTYPTASLMKVVTAAAALRHVPEAAHRACRYRGSPYVVSRRQLAPPRGGGILDTFGGALAISNNQCFARLAVRDVGKARLLAEMTELGMFDAPAPRHPAVRVDALEDELDLGLLGSGLAGSFISPLGAARLAAVLAGGELVRPFWIARIRDAEGNALPIPGREHPRTIWPAELTGELRGLLTGVTETGTASRAFHTETGQPLLGDVRVAGKTGTLNGTDPRGLYQWFIGVAPADAPRIAIAAVTVRDTAASSALVGGASASDARRASSASDVAAATLRELFCDGAHCDPQRAERLHARVRARELAAQAEADQRLAARKLAKLREQEREKLLDAPVRVIGKPTIVFPRHLRREPARGEIVLLVDLDREGRVVDVAVDRSDLPRLEAFVVKQVKRWKFTPPTRRGEPVATSAKLPISVDID
jgi:TonB family protein